MKKQTGIWIDSSKAIIVKLEDKQEHVIEVNSEIENSVHHKVNGDTGNFTGSRHSNNEGKYDKKKKHQIDDFLNNVIKKIENDDEIYVIGPAEIKLKLRQSIQKDKQLALKLKTTETTAAMTKNQVLAKVKEFYNLKH